MFNNKLIQLIVIALLIGSAYLVGSLRTELALLKKGVGTTTAVPTGIPQPSQPANPTVDKIKDAFNKSFIKFGDAKKKLLLVEVADPSCPYCHAAAGKDPELNKQLGNQFVLASDGGTYVAPVPEMRKLIDSGKASFAYIYFPGHGNGEMGTKALYCGFEKNKFWEVHDLLMTNAGYNLLNTTVKNDKSKSQEVATFLQSSFDAGTMKTCLDSGKYDSRLTQDVQLARDLGVSGTPGFFVNDKPFAGAYSYKDMESSVTQALQ